MAETRSSNARSCRSSISTPAPDCRSVSKLCLSRPPDTAKFPNHHGVGVGDERASSEKPPAQIGGNGQPPPYPPAAQDAPFSSAVTRKVSNRFGGILTFTFRSLFCLSCLFAFGMREAKHRAFRESRGRQPSGRMVVVYYNYHPASKNPCREVAKLPINRIFVYYSCHLKHGGSS